MKDGRSSLCNKNVNLMLKMDLINLIVNDLAKNGFTVDKGLSFMLKMG